MAKFIPVEPDKWAEMVKTQAEVARLEALTSEMDKTINASQSECRRLKAEVERLTEAGDAMAVWISIIGRRSTCGEIEEWLRAKKGLPSLKEQYEKQKLLGWDYVRPPMPDADTKGGQP